MKRDDIKPEELEGLLVAFADGELDEPRSSEVADLISEHADLAVRVEEYMSTGNQLKDFFDTEHIETPAHIADRILQMADKTKSGLAASMRPPESSNVLNFSTFKKLSSKLSITTQSLAQMAAALTIGVFLGPSLFGEFENTETYQSKPSNEELRKINSAIKSIQSDPSRDEIRKINSAIKSIQLDLSILLEKQSRSDFAAKFKVLKDEDGFALLLNRKEVEKLSVEIPQAKHCPELGGWLVDNVPMRDVNRFYVLSSYDYVKIPDKYSVCKMANGEWSVGPSDPAETAHVVLE